MAIKCPKCHFENLDDTIYCGKCASPLKPAEVISVTKTLETPIEELTRRSLFANSYEIIEDLGAGCKREASWIEGILRRKEISDLA